jgi:YbbR domain-containing protein
MKAAFLSRTYQRLRHAHVDNLGLKLLSLGVAILLFVVSRQPVSDVHLHGAPIEYRGVRPGLEISGELDQTASLRLRGPRDVVRNLLSNQLSVIADLTNKEPGERVVQLRLDDESLPDNTRVLQIEPASIKLRLEPTERKRVTVEPQYLGQLPEGMEIHGVQINPPAMEIEGPQSSIKKTDYLLTESISLSGRRENFSVTVEVETPNDSLRVIEPRTVNLSIEIGERRATRKFANIPVHWLDQPASGRLSTKSVEVELFGPQSMIESLRPEDLRVELKTADVKAGGAAQPQIRFPNHVGQQIQIKHIFPKEVQVSKP